MNIKDKIIELFPDAEPLELPSWLDEEVKQEESVIKSYLWKGDRIRKIRLCELNIENKFQAETLVIYPDFCYDVPILGTEYLKISNKKYFGAVDLHPLKNNPQYEEKYIQKYLGDFPNRSKNSSKIYDLNQFFSKKFWIEKKSEDFYEEYYKVVSKYLTRFKDCLYSSEKTESVFGDHVKYDIHLSTTDPAYGILKAYYNKDFAEKYIDTFLFDLKLVNT